MVRSWILGMKGRNQRHHNQRALAESHSVYLQLARGRPVHVGWGARGGVGDGGV